MFAFDPEGRRWVPAGTPGAVAVPPLRGEMRTDEASLRWAADDFGHVVHHRPRAVLRPAGVADVQAAVRFAAAARLTVAARGAGHSLHGQAQAPGGVVLDMSALSAVGDVRGDLVTVQAGATWAAVLDVALAAGRTPPVLTDYLHTTVGGTLAAGGVGGASHRHGFGVDSVTELQVVTGDGELRTCSPDREPQLFAAVLGGLGQCAVVVAATLRLVPAPPRVRRYRLGYPDLAAYLADQRLLAGSGRVGYLEGQVLPAGAGGWSFEIEAGTFYSPPEVPDDGALLGDLGHDPDTVEIDDLSYRDFQHRMAPGEEELRAGGEWWHPHAWLNVLLPADRTREVVHATLAGLDPADLGAAGLVLLYPVLAAPARTPLPRTPPPRTPPPRMPPPRMPPRPRAEPLTSRPGTAAGPLCWLFALLRSASADDPGHVTALVEANRVVLDRAVASGGVAYPVNTLAMSPQDWRVHFGDAADALRAAQQRFDPHRLFAPGQRLTLP